LLNTNKNIDEFIQEPPMTPRIGPIVQAAYLVSDLSQSIEQWSAALGLPLFYRIDNVPFDSMTYRGQPIEFPLSTAIAYSGDLQIELLLKLPEQEARFPEFFRTGEEKLHHYQIRTSNIDALLKEKHWQDKTLLRGNSRAGMQICFVDAGLPDGSYIELVETSDDVLMFMDKFKTLSNTWTGEPQVVSKEQLIKLIYRTNE